jgi:hypothetical protein
MLEFLSQIFTFVYKILSVLTPALNYLPQYFLMDRQKTTGMFSNETCFLLIYSNLLRIAFWFKKEFETCLLLQSVVVIALQVLLLYKFIEVSSAQNTKSIPTQTNNSSSSIFSKSTKRLLKLLVPIFIVFLLFLSVFIRVESNGMTELTGIVASLIETILPFPQLKKVWRNKDVKGLRLDNQLHDDFLLGIR